MRIAVFDYKVIPNNPAGSVHRQLLRGLCDQHEFTVFATEFDNPCPQRIEFVRVPALSRPLWVLFLTFHLFAPLCYLLHRIRRRKKFDRIQMVESNLLFGDLSYAHFCHRAFYREHRNLIDARTLRGKMRLLDHWLHAKLEPWVFRRVRQIVVPSAGLARELTREYPFAGGKIIKISNPIDLEKMRPPVEFDRAAHRASHGFAADDLIVAFVALGHFERKGLPQLLEAMSAVRVERLKLWVVGGEAGLIEAYRARCSALGVAERVRFAGMHKDVRPFLWASDAFALPSFYETFSLVAFEAAASGLPVMTPRFHGVDEFLVDRHNGIAITTDVSSISNGLQSLAGASRQDLAALGAAAASSVKPFGVEAFLGRWKAVYGN